MDRTLADIPKEELTDALKGMLNTLKIPGSIVNEYDLYEAVYREWEKVRRVKDEHKSVCGVGL